MNLKNCSTRLTAFAALLLGTVLGFGFVVCSHGGRVVAEEPNDSELENTAIRFVATLLAKDKAGLQQNFVYIDELNEFIKSDGTIQLADAIVDQYGTPGKCLQKKIVPMEGYKLVYLDYEAENATLKLHVTFSGPKIAGFFVDPEEEQNDPEFQKQLAARKEELKTTSQMFIASLLGVKDSVSIDKFPYTDEMKQAFITENKWQEIPKMIDSLFGQVGDLVAAHYNRQGKYETIMLYFKGSKEQPVMLVTWQGNQIAGFHMDKWDPKQLNQQPAAPAK